MRFCVAALLAGFAGMAAADLVSTPQLASPPGNEPPIAAVPAEAPRPAPAPIIVANPPSGAAAVPAAAANRVPRGPVITIPAERPREPAEAIAASAPAPIVVSNPPPSAPSVVANPASVSAPAVVANPPPAAPVPVARANPPPASRLSETVSVPHGVNFAHIGPATENSLPSLPPPAPRETAPAALAATPPPVVRQLPVAPAAIAAPAVTSLPPAAAPSAVPDPARVVQAAAALPSPVPLRDDPNFPRLPILKTNIAFWTKVFAEWSENQSVLHSMDDLTKVYDVLDFREQAAVMDPIPFAAMRGREERRAREELVARLERVDRLKDNPDALSAEDRRLWQMYAGSSDPKRFRYAVESLRMQRGLRERTAHALEVSGRYLPQMERVFASYGLPTLLTRLPLMESSFNLEAYSKAGASGVWQFIPSSARIYMRLNEVVDDRRDPWFSTDAAARHLRDDYTALQDWPLAVTAYNHGRGGIARALAAVGGSSLNDLLLRFDGPRWGFASRNYYAEFLAAADVERDWRRHFGELQREAPVQFEMVETRDYVPYDTLRRISGMDNGLFRTLNPAYRDEVLAGKLYVPPGHPIRVPAGTAERFKLSYAALGSDQRFDRQREFYLIHVLRRGESIGKLARRYGVSQREILDANGFASAKRVRVGQSIRIPRHEGIVIAAAEEERPAHALKAVLRAKAPAAGSVRTHRVRAGQTLSAIARQYQTSVAELRQLNHLRGDSLRVGMTLKIPRES